MALQPADGSMWTGRLLRLAAAKGAEMVSLLEAAAARSQRRRKVTAR